ncbi:sensor domain-containing diguanylate cyclase [Alicyclobacillus macrosporangiidus]|uniref:Diguanylate cyclase (GGDEF) domain-containing protein n=1 Tax=Alicyclobacillus macrosporangiidus TaxID=392015 RepID=A0A1I7J060_9BACL|nr:sensor domain-containing diguanylate cyclase [Alicyclobacillus macrosporangiidus]SFU78589.1 diguanylate cyclase (GGDEF) domain-containing protein [Alicyclobacillus macrosporangiidus]
MTNLKWNRVYQAAAYELLVAAGGLAVAIASFPGINPHRVALAVLLLLVASFLEAIPVSLGKAFGSLMLVVPLGVLVLYGGRAAVSLILGAELLGQLLSRRRMMWTTWLFNAGQYALSAWVMWRVYGWVTGGQLLQMTDIGVLLGAVAGATAFLLVNHLFVNILQALRGKFSVGEMLELLWHDGFNVMLSLPLAYVMVVVSGPFPYLGALVTLPIALVGQTLRVYRRMAELQRVHGATARLASEFDVDRICQEAAETACQVTYADAVVVWTLGPDGDTLVPNAIHPLAQAEHFRLEGLRREERGVIWHVLDGEGWAYVPNTLKDPRVRFGGKGVLYRSMAVFPMRAHGQAHGAIVCYGERPYQFGRDRAQHLETLAAQVAVLLENAKLYQSLQEQSWRDAATGLYNYRYFYRALEQQVREASAAHRELSVAIVDVDHFKKFNDTYGHLAGDQVLRSLAGVLQELAGPDAVVARYGGEEFGIILPVGTKDALERLEAIRQAASRHVVAYNGYHLQGITVSCGLATFPVHADNDRDLLAKADSTLYWGAKQRGRNRVAVYGPEYEAQLFVDELTGLYTYHFLTLRVREDFQRGFRTWGAVCIDLHNFSFVNSAFGFDVGDRVLKDTAMLIKDCLRRDELACRYGGDEFLVLIANTGPTEMRHIAERVGRAISSHRFECGGSVVINLRATLVTRCYDGLEDVTDLFDRVSSVFANMNQHATEMA